MGRHGGVDVDGDPVGRHVGVVRREDGEFGRVARIIDHEFEIEDGRLGRFTTGCVRSISCGIQGLL